MKGNFNHDYHDNQNIAHPYYVVHCIFNNNTFTDIYMVNVHVYTCTCTELHMNMYMYMQ